jgi:hypothetical protein
VRTYHPGLFPFEDTALHRMPDDRHQVTNVAAEHGHEVDRLEKVLQDWLRDQLPTGDDPMDAIIREGPWRYVQPDRWIDRLRARRRDADADAIAERLSASPAGRSA